VHWCRGNYLPYLEKLFAITSVIFVVTDSKKKLPTTIAPQNISEYISTFEKPPQCKWEPYV
jgi:hypothetical protein